MGFNYDNSLFGDEMPRKRDMSVDDATLSAIC